MTWYLYIDSYLSLNKISKVDKNLNIEEKTSINIMAHFLWAYIGTPNIIKFISAKKNKSTTQYTTTSILFERKIFITTWNTTTDKKEIIISVLILNFLKATLWISLVFLYKCSVTREEYSFLI